MLDAFWAPGDKPGSASKASAAYDSRKDGFQDRDPILPQGNRVTDQDLRVPPSNHFEKLRGDLPDFHSIRANAKWRLIFRWDGAKGDASGDYLDDRSDQ